MDRLEEAWWGLVQSSVCWKSRDFRLGASLYYLVGETALSWGGAVGHFVSWPMEGQSSTSRSGWGHHRGPVSTGGVFSSGGKLKFLCLFPSKFLSLWDSENTDPNTAVNSSHFYSPVGSCCHTDVTAVHCSIQIGLGMLRASNCAVDGCEAAHGAQQKCMCVLLFWNEKSFRWRKDELWIEMKSVDPSASILLRQGRVIAGIVYVEAQFTPSYSWSVLWTPTRHPKVTNTHRSWEDDALIAWMMWVNWCCLVFLCSRLCVHLWVTQSEYVVVISEATEMRLWGGVGSPPPLLIWSSQSRVCLCRFFHEGRRGASHLQHITGGKEIQPDSRRHRQMSNAI